MGEPVGSIASIAGAVLPVGQLLTGPIGRQIKYLNYKSNLEKLKKEVLKLKDARQELKGKVDAAEKNMEEIKYCVKYWQKAANSIIDEAENLIEQKNKPSSNPGLITRYKHGKQAYKLMKDKISQLLQENGEMGNISYPATLPEDRSLAADTDYDPFQSRESTLKKVVNALNDTNLNMIGIHGMPGVGKTTLVKEVGRQVKKQKLFDEVVFIEVTRTVDEKRILKELGDKLGLRFNNETETRNKLYARLTNSREENEEKKKEKKQKKEEKEKEEEEKILIILDNVWEEVDLKSIGIPDGDYNGKCKLLLTTRERDLLERMDSKVFEIDLLSEEESWRLFKNPTGDFIETSELKSLAEDICKKCGCLPIAIVTVAKAIKNKRDPREFKEALRQLSRPSPTNFTGALKIAYSSIEFSYNFLSSEELRKTFLLCSLMRHPGLTLDLVKYVLGFDIFAGVYTVEEARNKVYTLVNELKDSCLLTKDQANNSFSMHDFICEVALSIANRDDHVFSVTNEIEWEWPSHDRLKLCKKIFIRDSSMSELHAGLECPELESFFMNTKVGISRVKIPENFFIGMTKLKVLQMTRMRFSSLQSSLHLLKSLQTLCLDYSKFEDVASIGKLEILRILSLRGSNVDQLPKEIGQLTQLRLLDLSDCRQLKAIAPNVLSRLSRLEELYMRGSAFRWKDKILNELNHLSKLTNLDIHIGYRNIFPKALSFKKLERYKISVGSNIFIPCLCCQFGGLDYTKNFDKHETLRRLQLIEHYSIIRSGEFGCFKNVEFLCLGKLKGIKNVLYELDKEGLSQLKDLHVHNNPNLVCIVDSKNCIAHDAFPNLEFLYLFNLIKLENIFRGHPTTKSFSNLKIIHVVSCVKLKNIFSFSYARSLPQLRSMSVDDCNNLTEIFSNEREDNNNSSNNEVVDDIECCQLRFLTLKYLPKLTSIYSELKKHSSIQEGQKDKLDTPTPLINVKVVFPNLEVLDLREINSVKIWDCQCATLMSSAYKNLTRLNVWGCNKIKYVFPSSMVKSFQQLQCLEICKCKSLKAVVGKGEREGEAMEFIFPKVTFLSLKWLPQLESIYPGTHISEWPMLKDLVVCYCDKVKIFNSKTNEGRVRRLDISMPQSLFLFEKINSNLETLKLSEMECKMIWQGQFPHHHFCNLKDLRVKHDESTNIPIRLFQRFKFLGDEKHIWIASLAQTSLSELQNLEVLQVFGCDHLINLAQSSISFQNLTVLKIKRCNRLIHIVTSLTAKSLEQLREMKISSCKMMTEVVGNEREARRDEIIVFKNLKFLSLNHLKSLECFCSGYYSFDFPSLIELKVNKCHKMRTFCGGVLRTPKLQEVKNSMYNERYWNDDLNTTIQILHKKYKGRGIRLLMIFIISITIAVIDSNLSQRGKLRVLYVHHGTISMEFFLSGNFRRFGLPFVGPVSTGCVACLLGLILEQHQQFESMLGIPIIIYGYHSIYFIYWMWTYRRSLFKRVLKELRFLIFEDVDDYFWSFMDKLVDYYSTPKNRTRMARFDARFWCKIIIFLLGIIAICQLYTYDVPRLIDYYNVVKQLWNVL